MEEDKATRSGTGGQLLGSLAAAALTVALAIWAVTARLGPTSIAEQEAAEERAEETGEGGGNRRRRGRDR